MDSNDPVSKLVQRLPELDIDHISVCLTLRERGERARRLWTKAGMPVAKTADFSQYWKKRAQGDPALARRIIDLYLEHYSKSGDQTQTLDCNAHPEAVDLNALLHSPGPFVARSVRRVMAAVLGEGALPPRVAPPPLATQIATASKSFVKWATGGLKTVSPEELERRKAICAGCEFWDSEAFGGTGRCQKCGCSTWAKLQMATESCPVGKWGPVQE